MVSCCCKHLLLLDLQQEGIDPSFVERVKCFCKANRYHVEFRSPFTGFSSDYSEDEYEVCVGMVMFDVMLPVSEFVTQS